MSEIKLKPCPFCGGEAKDTIHKTGYGVFCEDCRAAIKVCATPKVAIVAWNRRAQPENQALKVEELNSMKDVPIYVVELEKHWEDGWCIWNGSEALIPNCRSWWHDYNDYGVTWLAYRHKPDNGEQREG